MARKTDLIYDFGSGRKDRGKISSLSIHKGKEGTALYSYATPIAYRDKKGNIYMADKKYSVTTSTDQNVIKRAYSPKIEDKEMFKNRLEKDGIFSTGRL